MSELDTETKRVDESKPLYKETCKYFENGNCLNGESCRFSHDKYFYPRQCSKCAMYSTMSHGESICGTCKLSTSAVAPSSTVDSSDRRRSSRSRERGRDRNRSRSRDKSRSRSHERDRSSSRDKNRGRDYARDRNRSRSRSRSRDRSRRYDRNYTARGKSRSPIRERDYRSLDRRTSRHSRSPDRRSGRYTKRSRTPDRYYDNRRDHERYRQYERPHKRSKLAFPKSNYLCLHTNCNTHPRLGYNYCYEHGADERKLIQARRHEQSSSSDRQK